MVRGMALTAHMVTIDCADPKSLAGFWTEALGYVQVADLGGIPDLAARRWIARWADREPAGGARTDGREESRPPRSGSNRPDGRGCAAGRRSARSRCGSIPTPGSPGRCLQIRRGTCSVCQDRPRRRRTVSDRRSRTEGGAVQPDPGMASEPEVTKGRAMESLVGHLLVATPSLRDPELRADRRAARRPRGGRRARRRAQPGHRGRRGRGARRLGRPRQRPVGRLRGRPGAARVGDLPGPLRGPPSGDTRGFSRVHGAIGTVDLTSDPRRSCATSWSGSGSSPATPAGRPGSSRRRSPAAPGSTFNALPERPLHRPARTTCGPMVLRRQGGMMRRGRPLPRRPDAELSLAPRRDRSTAGRGMPSVDRRWERCVISCECLPPAGARGRGAAGSAPHWQCGGQGFESPRLHPTETLWPRAASQGVFVPTTCPIHAVDPIAPPVSAGRWRASSMRASSAAAMA